MQIFVLKYWKIYIAFKLEKYVLMEEREKRARSNFLWKALLWRFKEDGNHKRSV